MSDVSEDALYEALVWALQTDEARARFAASVANVVYRVSPQEKAARALLEAARWFREHEEWFCPECNGAPEHHHVTCTVDRWGRAAERAGL